MPPDPAHSAHQAPEDASIRASVEVGGKHDDFDDSQRLVHTDPALKLLATKFLACEVHYAGSETRSDPSALEWAAWDAHWAMVGAREGGPEGVVAHMADSSFIDPDDPPPCLMGHVTDVLAAVR